MVERVEEQRGGACEVFDCHPLTLSPSRTLALSHSHSGGLNVLPRHLFSGAPAPVAVLPVPAAVAVRLRRGSALARRDAAGRVAQRGRHLVPQGARMVRDGGALLGADAAGGGT